MHRMVMIFCSTYSSTSEDCFRYAYHALEIHRKFLGALEVEKVGQKWVVAHFFERKVQGARMGTNLQK